ncbi:MAG TPA: hypothetical protein VHS05_12095 [Pyrinomonadaceae bacterium]|nr:hypothetical protein [Pyrinomonadaceae bacterium]
MVDTLRNYTFLPWLRTGIAAEIPQEDNLGIPSDALERASVKVDLVVGAEPISKTAQLLGPGDVLGINPRAIVKTEPRDGVTDFEANYLSYIEFYEEDFPWRFTPAKAPALEPARLRPWIFLLVLTEDEFEDKPTSGPLPAFELKQPLTAQQFFPKISQTYLWAHVHVNQNVIGEGVLRASAPAEVSAVEQKLADVLRVNPDNASSRLLCPRKLKESTAYHAFVIPAFEAGRLAGLGLEIPEPMNGQKSSWEDPVTIYPIYYRWFFRTGTKGDFEFLVDLLEAHPVDKRVGVREMDMQDPNYETTGMVPPFDVMGLEGALQSTEMEPFPTPWPPAGPGVQDPGSPGLFLKQLEDNVNMQFTLQQEETDGNPHPDPIISPPLYGKWYAQVDKLDVQNGAGWVNELNRDPRYRAPAGAGTQVVQKDQEDLMQQAWSQLGDLLRANQRIRQLQLGLMSSFALYRKNILPQSADQLLAFTQAVQSRVLGSPVTVARQVEESRLPQAALDPAFRKITRSRGAIMQKIAPEVHTPDRKIVTLLNQGSLTAAPTPPEPTGQILIDKVADAIDPVDIPDWLRRLLRNGTARWILIGIIVLALVLAFVTGLFILFIPIAVAAAVVLPFSETLRKRIETAETFHESSFTPAFVDSVPPRPNFALTSFRQPLPPVSGTGNTDSVEGANFRIALRDAFNAHQILPPTPPPKQPLNIDTTVEKLRQALNPSLTIPRRAEFILKIPPAIKAGYLLPQQTLVTVMAHPIFTQPMYQPLRDISSEFLCPNLELIPNNTISLMQSNQRFIEAYMVGLNHEMGCELLWGEFPTDQRGSYFRQFWDVGDVVNRDPNKTRAQLEESLLDIEKLHEWESESALGTHAQRPLPAGGNTDDSNVVLVVRGDLLKKYPTVVIYAQRARWTQENGRNVRVLDESDPATRIKHPIFKAEIEPDIRFLGFDLIKKEAKGSAEFEVNDPGWFFVLQERPGEPRFGLDIKSPESEEKPTSWNGVAWEHLSNQQTLDFVDVAANVPDLGVMIDPDKDFIWGRNAADMAYILYQVPVMVAFHAADMLP